MKQIEVYWDNQLSNSEGWYWVISENGVIVDDSVKIWAPVDAEAFDRDDESFLREALELAYPDAEITIKN